MQFISGIVVGALIIGVWIAASFVGIRMNASQYIALFIGIWAPIYVAIGMRRWVSGVMLLAVFFIGYGLIASRGFQI
jgi:hypothetical protein